MTSQSEHNQEGNPLAVITAGIVKAIQQHLMFHTLRRTGNSRDDAGALISRLLKPLTVVHAILKLTDAEVNEAALFEKAELEEPGKKSLLKLELQRPVAHSVSALIPPLFPIRTTLNVLHPQAFYSEARKKISLPSDNQIRLLTIVTATSPHTKLLITAELIKLILMHGPENIIPSSLHGSQTAIVTQEDLKIPAAHLPTFKPVPLTKEKKNYGTQIIVYMLLALYHEAMLEYFESHGIHAVCINGRQSPKERNDIINTFKSDPTIHVLLMSGII
jgi:SNF2 family DNA or RNA helicase